MTIKEEAALMKLNSSQMAVVSAENRNRALQALLDALLANKEKIFAANKEDLERAEADGLQASVLKRLKFQKDKLSEVTKGIQDLIALPDPLDRKSVV